MYINPDFKHILLLQPLGPPVKISHMMKRLNLLMLSSFSNFRHEFFSHKHFYPLAGEAEHTFAQPS
jgi:hypothetical protein